MENIRDRAKRICAAALACGIPCAAHAAADGLDGAGGLAILAALVGALVGLAWLVAVVICFFLPKNKRSGARRRAWKWALGVWMISFAARALAGGGALVGALGMIAVAFSPLLSLGAGNAESESTKKEES